MSEKSGKVTYDSLSGTQRWTIGMPRLVQPRRDKDTYMWWGFGNVVSYLRLMYYYGVAHFFVHLFFCVVWHELFQPLLTLLEIGQFLSFSAFHLLFELGDAGIARRRKRGAVIFYVVFYVLMWVASVANLVTRFVYMDCASWTSKPPNQLLPGAKLNICLDAFYQRAELFTFISLWVIIVLQVVGLVMIILWSVAVHSDLPEAVEVFPQLKGSGVVTGRAGMTSRNDTESMHDTAVVTTKAPAMAQLTHRRPTATTTK